MIRGSPVVDWAFREHSSDGQMMFVKFPVVFSENKPQKTKIKPASHVTNPSEIKGKMGFISSIVNRTFWLHPDYLQLNKNNNKKEEFHVMISRSCTSFRSSWCLYPFLHSMRTNHAFVFQQCVGQLK